jgi:hypothetical protein
MNNNNLYNTNNFIGITHYDYFKTASNALAKAINTLDLNSSNYTCNVSNILDNNSSNYTRNTSNAILARYDPMIRQETKPVSVDTPLLINPMPVNLQHTYIYNSNVLGEIRFWCKDTQSFPIPVSLNVPDYRVKIDFDGKLKVYYTYDPFISLTIGNTWLDVSTSLASLTTSDINIGITLAGLEAQIQNNFAIVQEQFAALFCNLYEDDIITSNMRNRIEVDTAAILASSTVTTTRGTLEQLYIYMSAFYRTQRLSRLSQAINLINLRISQNATAAFFLGAGGVALGFIYGIAQAESHNDFITTTLNSAITSNLYFTTQQKRVLYDSNTISIMSNYIDQLEYTSNITAIQGFINTYNSNQQYIPSIKCETLDLNSGNITAVNTINVNTINISGKVKQFGNYLDDTYLKPEDLYNLSYNYTTERRYPPKAYNSSTTEKTVNLLETLVYNQTLILDNIGITYGDGQYEIYSSSTYDNGITNKDKLFNFDNTETVNTPRWAINQYNSGTGNYQGNSSIDGVDYGDFIIIKLPLPFLLTRFRFYKNTAFPQLAPSLWKCFGSSDGIEWFEIFQAHNFARLVEADYNFGFYEKTLANTFTTLFNYIGFSFNSLTGTSGATSLNFAELQLFGKEQQSYNIDSYKYTTPEAVKVVVRDNMPDVPKRRGFIVSIPNTATYYDGTTNITYYKYDLDLRLYLTQQIIPNTIDPYRSFKFACWYTPSYFGSYINSQPYVISYTIFMSNKANAILGQPDTAGLNIYAVGFPENVRLANILPNNIMLLKNANNNFNYLTIVSRIAPCDINCIIEDQLF